MSENDEVWREQSLEMLKLIVADVEAGKYRLSCLPEMERDAIEGPPSGCFRTFTPGPVRIVIKLEEVRR